MALGTPVVSTSKGAEGLEITHGQDILIADDPKSIAQAILQVLFDPVLRERLAHSGRKLVEKKYNWIEIGARFSQLVESLSKGR